MNFEDRLTKTREEMRKRNIGIMFLTYGANLWYLAGIHRQQPNMTDNNAYADYICGAYIGAEGEFVLIAPRMGGAFYQQEAKNKNWIDAVRIINEDEKPKDVLAEVGKMFHLKGKGISLDDRAWSHTSLILQQILHDSSISIASEILAPMRMIKDPDEVNLMKKAGQITDEVYGEVLKFLKLDVTEYEVASEIDLQFARRGADYPSFVTGVRFTKPGKAQSTGASRATFRKLEKGDAITFDFGTCYGGYCSDFGRTVFIGEPPTKFRKIHDLVIKSQAAAIEKMVSGNITTMQLDQVARSVIEKAGFGDCFTHRLGHGIGITVHEPPFLYKPDNTKILSGMTFTIEPSIRLPDSYSCRVEDVVMVTEKGGQPFSNFHKELTVIK